MDELKHNNLIRVKRKNVFLLQEHVDKIRSLFSVRLCEVPKQDFSNSYVVFFNVQLEHCDKGLPDINFISKVQRACITPPLADLEGTQAPLGHVTSFMIYNYLNCFQCITL
uniref:Uncharacterized protein n=1 Tax=Clastoptera arizonana TaxID=38151 RepID=A0A1B6EDV7_9HEMI